MTASRTGGFWLAVTYSDFIYPGLCLNVFPFSSFLKAMAEESIWPEEG
jgi:hypothetical protein